MRFKKLNRQKRNVLYFRNITGAFVEQIASEGKSILFAGTKKQAKKIIKDEAERCGMYYVDERWLGGCLTNFGTIRLQTHLTSC